MNHRSTNRKINNLLMILFKSKNQYIDFILSHICINRLLYHVWIGIIIRHFGDITLNISIRNPSEINAKCQKLIYTISEPNMKLNCMLSINNRAAGDRLNIKKQ